MILLGRFLSPFVRRVATTLNLYEMPFEHRPLQHTGDDAPTLRQYNPLGRVPALLLEDGRTLIDSAVIIDYLDRQAGPQRALTPADGVDRDRVLTLVAVATGAMDKSIATSYEVRFRPEERRHAPWVERCTEQAHGGYRHLESELEGDWFVAGRMTQADVSAAIGWQFTKISNPTLAAGVEVPRLDALVDRMMALPAYKSTLPD